MERVFDRAGGRPPRRPAVGLKVDFLDESIGRLSDKIDRVVLPFARQRDCSTRSPA